mmetsp:Transcript_15931/g.47516  ORF Transcript_15931/g.47516 Transcript_15931/m.47516 type:complete len:316 (-) Transcript_15931:246-1193(-)
MRRATRRQSRGAAAAGGSLTRCVHAQAVKPHWKKAASAPGRVPRTRARSRQASRAATSRSRMARRSTRGGSARSTRAPGGTGPRQAAQPRSVSKPPVSRASSCAMRSGSAPAPRRRRPLASPRHPVTSTPAAQRRTRFASASVGASATNGRSAHTPGPRNASRRRGASAQGRSADRRSMCECAVPWPGCAVSASAAQQAAAAPAARLGNRGGAPPVKPPRTTVAPPRAATASRANAARPRNAGSARAVAVPAKAPARSRQPSAYVRVEACIDASAARQYAARPDSRHRRARAARRTRPCVRSRAAKSTGSTKRGS